METRALNIQKRPNTTRLKYDRTGVSLDLGKKNGKNVFPLNMSFTVLKSLKQLAWRCLVETRAQNIQKRLNTTRLKYSRSVTPWPAQAGLREGVRKVPGIPWHLQVFLSGPLQEIACKNYTSEYLSGTGVGDKETRRSTRRSRGPVCHQGKRRTQPRSDDLSSWQDKSSSRKAESQ